MNQWTWTLDIARWAGRDVVLETTDGMRREGRITGIKYRKFPLTDSGKLHELSVPLHIELNNDPTDYIEILRLEKLTLK